MDHQKNSRIAILFTSLLLVSFVSIISATRPPRLGTDADFHMIVTKAERLAVGRCLRETIEPLFPDEIRENLSAAEFLGTFCTSLSAERIEKRYQERQLNAGTDGASASEPNTIGRDISICLQESRTLVVYSRYMVYGSSILEKQRKQYKKQVEEAKRQASLAQSQPSGQDDHQNSMALVPASPHPETNSDHEESMALVVANPQPEPARSVASQGTNGSPQPNTGNEQSMDMVVANPQPADRSDHDESMALIPANPLPASSTSSAVGDRSLQVGSSAGASNNTSEHGDDGDIWEPPEAGDCSEFARFALGLCNSNEFVNFDNLDENIEEDRLRRKEILNCSEECVQTFFYKIRSILVDQIHQIKVKQPETEMDGEEFMSYLNNFTQICKENEVNNFKLITEVGKNWFGIYSDVYNNIYKIYANLPTKDALESMDQKLATAFFDYESCIQWECSLKTGNDEPLYDWLDEIARPPVKNKLARVLMQEPTELQSPPPESHPSDIVEMLVNELGPGLEVANPTEPNHNNGQNQSTHINYDVPQFFQ